MKLSDIQKRFPKFLDGLVGSGDVGVDNVMPPDLANSTSLVFVTESKFLEQALASPAAALVLHADMKKEASGARSFLFSNNVKLAMALVKNEYFANEIPLQPRGQIHPTAVIDASASIGAGSSIGAYTVIGAKVSIGTNVQVDASVIIEADCKIGNDSHLFSHLYLGPRTEIGARCILMPHSAIGTEGFGFAHDERGKFHRIPQTGKVVIEDDVEVGSLTTIDRATFGITRIGEGTKIDKHAHIAHNCDIGKHCVLAGKFAVAGSAKIGDHLIAGGRVTVKDGVTITDGVELAGLSGVHTDVTTSGQYGGFPLQPVRDSMRSGMTLAHLPQMRKHISKILKHLDLEKE